MLIDAANIAAFEIDDEALANLRQYAFANNLYWALAEGHACEISARRNAMDVRSTAFFLVCNGIANEHRTLLPTLVT